MYRPQKAPAPRKGIILLVVLALLTLFTIIGISFVLYADAAALQAYHAKEAQVNLRPNMESDECLSLFLDQFIFDVPDDVTGVSSSLRGQSLSRNMYSFNYTLGANPGSVTQIGNTAPFIGIGRLHYPLTDPTTGKPITDSTTGQPYGDDWNLVNYMYYSSDKFVRDPECYGPRANLSTPRGPYLASANVSYTYPDLNNFYLAAVDGSGNLLTPSFHREYIFGRLDDQTNPNWTNAVGKYMTMRPRPNENPGFPYPIDRGGDVKNLVGYPGGCDSIWMDIGAPVLTTPDGRKYKMLVAPLILDLDGRVNINVHGNVVGYSSNSTFPHVSNQGLGPWEVNLSQVLTAPDVNGNPEWIKLFRGSPPPPVLQPTIWGRYGQGLVPVVNVNPANNTVTPFPWQPHFYAQIDYNGDVQYNNSAKKTIALPGKSPLSCFPTFPAGYGNADPNTELLNHPQLYNVFAPFAPSINMATNPWSPSPYYNRRFRTSNMDRFLRWADTGTEALTSELERLLPMNFNDPNDVPGSFMRRNLITTDSGDRNQPGIAPGIYDPTNTAYRYDVSTVPGQWNSAPFGQPTVFPDVTSAAIRTGALPPSSEFSADWRSAIGAALPRIDLNRTLTPYSTSAAQATKDRQTFARDIYLRLLAAVGLPSGATNMALPDGSTGPSDADLRARRWVAQLAVNIVDFIDSDNVSTPFNFYTAQDAGNANGFNPGSLITSSVGYFDPSGKQLTEENPRYWVFGTELPNVVINEVLTEFTPIVMPNANQTYTNNVWVELYNPFEPSPAKPNPNLSPSDTTPVSLTSYQLVIANQILPLTQDNNNVVGRPVNVRATTAPGGGDFGATTIGPKGYVVIGPGADVNNTVQHPPAPGVVPATVPILNSNNLKYTVTYQNATTVSPDDSAQGITVLLRRLANPNLPFDGNVTDAAYNPYITVDYIEHIPLNNSNSASYASRAKKQPYAARFIQAAGAANTAADSTSLVVDENLTASVSTKPFHTLGQQNDQPADSLSGMLPWNVQYDWLPHLDRPLISPIEILNVSQYQPYQLTQQFMLKDINDPTQRYQHAPSTTWFDDNRRFSRVFEFLEVADRALGTDPNGRTTGKININTVWDVETFMALCDPQAGNNFTAANVNTIWSGNSNNPALPGLLKLRSPNYTAGNNFTTNGSQVGPTDRPFLGYGTVANATSTQYPQGSGINDTILRSATVGNNTTARLFDLPPIPTANFTDNPYVKRQLLTKIANNITTRSNVFGVWLTVGFFQVTNTQTQPVQLGAEMNWSEGYAIRHRMFAIIDRSVLPRNLYDMKPPLFRPGADTTGLVPYWTIID